MKTPIGSVYAVFGFYTVTAGSACRLLSAAGTPIHRRLTGMVNALPALYLLFWQGECERAPLAVFTLEVDLPSQQLRQFLA